METSKVFAVGGVNSGTGQRNYLKSVEIYLCEHSISYCDYDNFLLDIINLCPFLFLSTIQIALQSEIIRLRPSWFPPPPPIYKIRFYLLIFNPISIFQYDSHSTDSARLSNSTQRLQFISSNLFIFI